MALKEHNRKDLESKFRNVHALIKKNRLISDIAWLNQLDREKGLDHSKTYDIYDCSDVFYGIYFPQEREKLIGNLSPSPWIPVQMTVTVLLNRKLYLLETVSRDLCVLVNPKQPVLKICLPV
jgi:hypothetical protein